MLSLLAVQGAYALPQGGQVVVGTGTVAQTGGSMTVTQTSPKLAINWQGFDIAAGQSVNFAQPGASSIVLNRVLGQNPTSVLGSLIANGQVFVVNPNGVLFGTGAQVNVGGLVASSRPMSDADFMAGTYRFIGSGAGTVSNQGSITAADGGYVTFIGQQVENSGSITANRGTVLLAGADQVTLQLNGSSLLGYTIDRGALNALANNQQSGSIRADGGKVVLNAQAVNQAATAVVNNDGVIEARTIGQSGGVIQLLGDMAVGHLVQNGRLDASAPSGGKGGTIEMSAGKVKVGDNAQITTASPAGPGSAGSFSATANDFLIGPSGAGADLSAVLLQNILDNNASVTIATSTVAGAGVGDITITRPLNWTANTTLSLVADRNITLNATAESAGGGKLFLRADSGGKGIGTVSLSSSAAPLMQGGQVDIYYDPANYATPTDFTPFIGGTLSAWMLVNDLAHLQAMNANLAGNYALGRNIDASTSAAMNGGTGFSPVGNSATPYSGQFDGQGKVISGLKINLIGSQDVGLFGVTSGRVANVGLEAVSIAGLTNVGALAGTNLGTITRSYSTGAVSIPVSDPANGFAGGLVGNNAGVLDKSWSSASVSGDASGIGGLVGINNHGSIAESYSSGSATARGSSAGGLAGFNTVGGRISNSYSAAGVNASSQAGGIAGTNEGLIFLTYSSGPTSALSEAGGLVGNNKGVVSGSYSSGTTSGIFDVGRMAGVNTGTIPTDTDGWLDPGSARQQSAYRVWDFANVWRQYDGSTLPLLRAFLTPLTVTVNAASKTYDGTPWSGQLNLTYSDPAAATSPSLHLGQPVTSAAPTDAGTYTVNYTLAPFSDQRNGYDITIGQAGPQTTTLAIDPKIIGVTGMAAADRAYDGTADATVTGGTLVGLVGAQTLGLTAVAMFNDKNAAGNKQVNVSTALQDGLGGGKAANYVVTNPLDLTATINPRDLSVTAIAANKVYDGTTVATATLASNQIAGDVLSLNYGVANFSDKNAATNGKAVLVTGVTVTGTDALNYRLVQPSASSTANITPRPVTVIATADDKRFDGSAIAAATVTPTNVLANELLTAGYTQASFNDAAVGQNKLVTVNGISISGADAANYSLLQNRATATASILPASSIPGLDLITLAPVSAVNGPALAGWLPGVYAKAPAGLNALNLDAWTATSTVRSGLPAAISSMLGSDSESGGRFDVELPGGTGSGASYAFGIVRPGIRMPPGFE